MPQLGRLPPTAHVDTSRHAEFRFQSPNQGQHGQRERDQFSDCILPRALWHLRGSRPANHPRRRVALASRCSLDGDIAFKLERWCARDVPGSAHAASLLEALQVEPDDFWSWHCTFRSPRLQQAQPLLGATRVTDLERATAE